MRMLFYNPCHLILIITFFLLHSSQSIDAANIGTIYFYEPEDIENIVDRSFADGPCTLNLLNMSIFGIGDNVLNEITWNVGDFSGISTPTPRNDYQRGINDTWYGSTAVQIANSEMGGQLHTESIGDSAQNYNLANLQVKYDWGEVNGVLPWTHSDSKLRFQFSLKIPDYYMVGGAVGYVYASLFLKDPNGKKFWLQPQVFDTRYAPSSEYIGWDSGTSSGYVNTFYDYNNNTQYCSKDEWSNWSTSEKWSDWRVYSFTVNREQLRKAVDDLNSG